MHLLQLITALALLMYMWTSFRVGMARGRLGIKAPATSGHPEFERLFRVHQNTLEQLIVFLPALWMFGTLIHEPTAAGLGAVFIVGRILYAITYAADASSRTTGFLVAYVASSVLLVGGLVGAVLALLGG